MGSQIYSEKNDITQNTGRSSRNEGSIETQRNWNWYKRENLDIRESTVAKNGGVSDEF